MLKFLTKLSNEELRNWKLSIKCNSLLIVKLIYFSNPFGKRFILRLNLPSSCRIRWESQFFKLWNAIGILWFNVRLILQSLFGEPLYFPVIWQ